MGKGGGGALATERSPTHPVVHAFVAVPDE